MQAVVLLSGGMDSAIALFWAIHEGHVIDAVCFDYGQRHRLEVARARDVWSIAIRTSHGNHRGYLQIVPLHSAVFGEQSSITNFDIPVTKYIDADDAEQHNTSDPAYVPARNAVLVSIAANYLLRKWPDGGMVITGFRGRASGPHGGFPDGSPEFSDLMSEVLTVGTFGIGDSVASNRVIVWDPLNRPGRSRADALRMAIDLPGCWEALSWTMSCFEGTEPPCGKCIVCLRREQGFRQFGKPDPLLVRLGRL